MIGMRFFIFFYSKIFGACACYALTQYTRKNIYKHLLTAIETKKLKFFIGIGCNGKKIAGIFMLFIFYIIPNSMFSNGNIIIIDWEYRVNVEQS